MSQKEIDDFLNTFIKDSNLKGRLGVINWDKVRLERIEKNLSYQVITLLPIITLNLID